MQDNRRDPHYDGRHATLTRFQAATEAVLNPSSPLAKGQPIRFGFCVGHLRLLLMPHTFSEVIPQAVIYPLPNVPPWFLGVLNQRGNLLPVFDLHQLLRARNRGHDNHTVLVLDQGSDAVGMLIDGMPQAVTLTRTQGQVPALSQALKAYVPAAYRAGDTVWLEFDHQAFFTATGAQITRA